jgi:hypothetical protein
MSAYLKTAPKEQGSALIVTLLAVTMLTVIAVAFLQSMRLARINSRSYYNINQADCAARAGLEMAIAQIRLATGTNASFVTGLYTGSTPAYPVTVIGPQDLTDTNRLMPLISGSLALLNDFGQPGWSIDAYVADRSDTAKSVDINTSRNFIQQTADTSLYRAAWVNMKTNQTGMLPTYSRFAYIVLDEQARLNPTLHTGTGTGFSNPTNWYSGPQDISLSGTTSGTGLLTVEQMQQVRADLASFRYSQETIGEVFPSRDAYEAVKHLFTSQTNITCDMIPGAMPDGGKPKYNINDLAVKTEYGDTAEERARNIADIIRRNLPNFYRRDQAYANNGDTASYVNSLAANIVDYIDDDATLTVVDGKPSGHEATCYLSLLSLLFTTTKQNGVMENTTTVTVQPFVSVWNPTQKNVIINSAHFSLTKRPPIIWGPGPTNTDDYDEIAINDNLPITARPNQFVLLKFAPMTITMSSPVAVVGGPFVSYTLQLMQYALKINDQIVGTSDTKTGGEQGGMQLDQNTLISGINYWENIQMDNNGTQVHDLRFASFYDTSWNCDHGTHYPSKAWNGLATGGNAANALQNFNLHWANRDYLPRNPIVGLCATSDAQLPDAIGTNYSTGDIQGVSAAPEFIRDGPMLSIGELGNIYDPVHADNNQQAKGERTSSDSFTSPVQDGGARTLRIGQQEPAWGTSWDTADLRAAGLLDLFTVNPATADSGTAGAAVGRINPNTAPIEVLTALFSGIQLKSDTGMLGGNRKLAQDAATRLAQAVINNRPYSALSDLHRQNNPSLDNPKDVLPTLLSQFDLYDPKLSPATTPTLPSTPQPNVKDSVREEAFGKIIQHLAVQSRTYRVYVIGQSLTPQQSPNSTVILEAVIYLKHHEPINETDAIQFDPIIQYVRTLK